MTETKLNSAHIPGGPYPIPKPPEPKPKTSDYPRGSDRDLAGLGI